jgi:hypothetical protein
LEAIGALLYRRCGGVEAKIHQMENFQQAGKFGAPAASSPGAELGRSMIFGSKNAKSNWSKVPPFLLGYSS